MTHHNSPSATSPVQILTILALCLVPLFLTPIIPTVDFYSHMSRYYILAHPQAVPDFAQNYAPAWRLLPNLGLDVVGTAVMSVLPPLLGAKVLAGLIILAPAMGCLSLAQAVHGRITVEQASLAGILAHSLILGWGFANFLLGLGLALWALGLWIRLGDRPGLQLLVTIAVAVPIFLVHGLVFALWGLLLLAFEAPGMMRGGLRGFAMGGGRLALVAVLPVILFLMSRTAQADGGVTVAFTNLAAHAENGQLLQRVLEEITKRIDSILRVSESNFAWPDRAFGLALWILLAWSIMSRRVRLESRLLPALALVAVLVVLTPPNMFGVGHLDERIPLVLLALLTAALGLGSGQIRDARPVSILLLAGFGLHLAMVSLGWYREGRIYATYLASIEALPPGGMATAIHLGDTQGRDEARPCNPLLPVLTLARNMAAPTFANPTQQPLAIVGPLRQALDASAALPTNLADNDLLASHAALGFKTLVVCDSNPAPAELPPGFSLVAQDGKWRLYRAE